MITKKQFDALYAHHCPSCLGIVPPAASGAIDLSKLFERAVKAVYKEKADAVMPQLTTAFSASLAGGVAEGYGKNMFGVKWDTPDWEMINHLQANCYEFSAAKSYQQLRALTDALYDSNGHIVPKKEFTDIARRINNEMGVAHLDTERNTAIAGGQMASRWVQFEKDKQNIPNLTYQTVGDGRVRPSHAKLDNITRPVDDIFWKEYYPPNGWNCRCDVVQSVNRAVTPADKIPVPDDVPDLFKTNLAEKALAFPEGHPVYDYLPPGLMQITKDKNPFSYKKIYQAEDGGYVYNSIISKASPDEIYAAQILAGKGDNVILLPRINANTEWDNELRKLCMPANTPERKNPDWMVNNKIAEYKNITNTVSAIDRAIRDASKQADIVCLNINGNTDEALLKKTIQARVDRTTIEQVWIMQDGTVTKYKRKEILDWK